MLQQIVETKTGSPSEVQQNEESTCHTTIIILWPGNDDLLVIHAWLFSHYYICSTSRKASCFIYL